MTVKELKARMDRGDAPTVIDVREPHELAICSIPGARADPAGPVAAADRRARPQRRRSSSTARAAAAAAEATQLLSERGFTNARNLTGGILAWIEQIDPSQPKY